MAVSQANRQQTDRPSHKPSRLQPQVSSIQAKVLAQAEEQAGKDRLVLRNLPSAVGNQSACDALQGTGGGGGGGGRQDPEGETKDSLRLEFDEAKMADAETNLDRDDLREPMLPLTRAENSSSATNEAFVGALGHIVGALKAQVRSKYAILSITETNRTAQHGTYTPPTNTQADDLAALTQHVARGVKDEVEGGLAGPMNMGRNVVGAVQNSIQNATSWDESRSANVAFVTMKGHVAAATLSMVHLTHLPFTLKVRDDGYPSFLQWSER